MFSPGLQPLRLSKGRAMMSRTAARILLGLLIALASPILFAKDNKQAEAEALLQRARELSDIRCEGCPPFRLVARVRVTPARGIQPDGEYDLLWASSEQWREDIKFPDFTQQTYGSRLRVWRVRSLPYLPQHVLILRGQLLALKNLRLEPGE
jgi:hypothetical protein